jgi:hypothetical protein
LWGVEFSIAQEVGRRVGSGAGLAGGYSFIYGWVGG